MPIHDWTRVQSGLFHEFHQSWSVRIKDALNGALPKGYYALVEQKVDGPEPDVIAVEMKTRGKGEPPRGATATLEPPKTALTAHVAPDAVRYARKANRISIRHPLGDVVAVDCDTKARTVTLTGKNMDLSAVADALHAGGFFGTLRSESAENTARASGNKSGKAR